ncbi:MAG: response regulator transcription factor [Clostridia bacterium]|nr:response regulator transcription factor [Clostridia bacterium]
MPINVLLVDDEDLITNSLKIILELEQDIKVAGTCSNGDEAYRRVLSVPETDVILMDIRMPVCDGVLATKKIIEVRPDVKIIILTTFNDDEYIFEALKNGAKGYLLKSISPDKIIEAIKIVYQGNLLIHPDVALKLSGMLNKENQSKVMDNLSICDLTDMEKDIVKLISDGMTNKEIADKVYLSEGTVKNKISDILEKLGLRDRTQIAIFYLKGGRL